ncbi:pili assembly chaperone [Pseudomonas sp. NPDC089422]|uniref:PFGI-1 class ICE element type IV pilus protein PilL2 n=1 Tax=Pseudomonas sp. NPDC089422 TaxID=3364466 RepID=UPI00380DE09F
MPRTGSSVSTQHAATGAHPCTTRPRPGLSGQVKVPGTRLGLTGPLHLSQHPANAGAATPLYQLIDVQIAPSLHATVGEALHHVLQCSGYSLCTESPAVARLFRRTLPAVNHDLGPMSLLDALTVIDGPAWRLDIDRVERSMCYALRQPTSKPPLSTLETAPSRLIIFKPW